MQGSKVIVQGWGGFPSVPLSLSFWGVPWQGDHLPSYNPVALVPGSCRQKEGSHLTVCLVGLSGALGGVALEMALSLLHAVAWLSQGLGTLPDLYCFYLV